MGERVRVGVGESVAVGVGDDVGEAVKVGVLEGTTVLDGVKDGMCNGGKPVSTTSGRNKVTSSVGVRVGVVLAWAKLFDTERLTIKKVVSPMITKTGML